MFFLPLGVLVRVLLLAKVVAEVDASGRDFPDGPGASGSPGASGGCGGSDLGGSPDDISF